MELVFEYGNSLEPKGHALIYFRDQVDPDRVYATYLVVFPLAVNISKYIPPFLASSLGGATMSEISSFPMPPVAEEVESYQRLVRLAESRSDDLLFGGTISGGGVASSVQAIGEISKRYTEIWNQFNEGNMAAIEEAVDEGVGVAEVMYSLLSEKDRLNELATLLAKHRFAVEGNDAELKAEIEAEMKTLSQYMPERFKLEKLLEVVGDASVRCTRLAQLYVNRCYGLFADKTDEVADLDKEIAALEASE